MKQRVTEDNVDNDVGERVTLDALDAISSSDESDSNDNGADEEWNAEAQALRQAIADGAFDHLMKKNQSKEENDAVKEVLLQGDDSVEDDDDSEEESKIAATIMKNNTGKALVAVTEQLQSAKRGMPWVETFDVISENPLPFDIKRGGNPLDVHDDLKRELAFYNAALEGVNVARKNCADAGVPFSRPDDFFVEMVKTDGACKNNRLYCNLRHEWGCHLIFCDVFSLCECFSLFIDHMAKIKDRLIYENKKMDAFAQRKANKEHKLHAKEAHSHKLAEKAKRKRQHMDALNNWQDTNNDSLIFDETKNKKRMAADKKYGHGGRRGRFKQTDPRDLNDMSSFRPKGSSGAGAKWQGSSGNNKKRQGKRARDAARSRR